MIAAGNIYQAFASLSHEYFLEIDISSSVVRTRAEWKRVMGSGIMKALGKAGFIGHEENEKAYFTARELMNDCTLVIFQNSKGELVTLELQSDETDVVSKICSR